MSAEQGGPIRIALVGCDGCGKSTQVARLQAALLGACINVAIDDKWQLLDVGTFPECRFIASDRATLRSCVSEMEGTARTLFVFWLICLAAEKSLRSHGVEIVIHDGYWPKHACAEIEYGAKLEFVTALAAALPRSDLTILLDAAPETALARKVRAGGLTAYECGRDVSKQVSRFLEHQSRIRERLLVMAAASGWCVVDASKSEEDVWSKVEKVTNAYLGNIRSVRLSEVALQ